MKKKTLIIAYSLIIFTSVFLAETFSQPAHAFVCGYYCNACTVLENEQSIFDCKPQRFGTTAACLMYCPY